MSLIGGEKLANLIERVNTISFIIIAEKINASQLTLHRSLRHSLNLKYCEQRRF